MSLITTTLPTTLPASKARSNFYTLLEEVSKKLKKFTITRYGIAKAVVMHPDEIAAWEETMDILANKKLIAEIAQAEKEIAQNKIVSEKALLKSLKIDEKELV